MASTMVINVRYFGTSKVKLGDSVRRINARFDKNGELDLNIGGLREKICRLFHLSHGADITLTYIDEDRDVVTLVDDDDLRDALRQRLKSFRIDVLMNEDKDGGKYSSSEKSRVMKDVVNVTSDVKTSIQPYPNHCDPDDLPADHEETEKATTSSADPASLNEDMSSNTFYDESFDDCFESEANSERRL